MPEFNLSSGNTIPFKMMGSSPVKQTKKKEKLKDLVDVFSLIPGMKYVKKSLRKVKEKVHKSKFAKKYLIVDPNPKLSKIGKFVKRHLSDPDKDIK